MSKVKKQANKDYDKIKVPKSLNISLVQSLAPDSLSFQLLDLFFNKNPFKLLSINLFKSVKFLKDRQIDKYKGARTIYERSLEVGKGNLIIDTQIRQKDGEKDRQ